MRKVAEGRDPAQLAENAKWLELLALRQSLQKLLPSELEKTIFGLFGVILNQHTR